MLEEYAPAAEVQRAAHGWDCMLHTWLLRKRQRHLRTSPLPLPEDPYEGLGFGDPGQRA